MIMSERLYDLKDDGVKMVTYPDNLREGVASVATLWQDFCALPDEIKRQFSATDQQWSIGYESKDGAGLHGDTKENFDYSSQGSEELMRTLESLDNETAQKFIAAVQLLGRQIIPMIEELGQDIEETYGVKGFHAKAKASASSAFLRFLHYPSGRSKDETIAEPHVDHSGFTFHLFETTDGCERLTREGEWEPLPVAGGQAAAFASMQTQLETRNEIKALTHRVLANETSARVGRYAIVCFVALLGTPSYDRKTHGRLQEMQPGFNYEMPYGEFSKLFK